MRKYRKNARHRASVVVHGAGAEWTLLSKHAGKTVQLQESISNVIQHPNELAY